MLLYCNRTAVYDVVVIGQRMDSFFLFYAVIAIGQRHMLLLL